MEPIDKIIFGDNQFETWGDAVRGVFSALTAPIRLVIKLIDMFLSKFDIYQKAKDKVIAIGDAVGESAESAWDWVRNKTGFGNDDEGTNAVDNTIKNHSVIDVNVTATGGAKADATSKNTGGVNLRTVENGIGG